jgi:hypothetical protein
VGVGNVDGLLVRADDSARRRTLGVFLCRGVLGYSLSSLHISEPVPLGDGDCIVIATDGVRGDLTGTVGPGVPVDRSARTILTTSATEDDDALVFVGRYRSPAATERAREDRSQQGERTGPAGRTSPAGRVDRAEPPE